MNETIQQIVSVCLPLLCLLITVGVAYAAALHRRETTKIEKVLDNETAAHYIGMAGAAVAQSVAYVAQTYADELKKTGTFDKEAQQQAFKIAKARAVQILGPVVMQALGEIYGDVDLWITTKIEQACREAKLAGAADTAAVTATAASVATSIAATAAQQIKAEAAEK